MSRRSRDRHSDFMVEQTIAYGGRLAAKHPDVVVYAGGLFIEMRKMAMIKWILQNKLCPKDIVPHLKLFYKYLDEERKAYFMSDGSDVLTKLSAMVGVNAPVRATDYADDTDEE